MDECVKTSKCISVYMSDVHNAKLKSKKQKDFLLA